MRIISAAAVCTATGFFMRCLAQQPPPPAPSLRSQNIPGGVLHWAGKGVAGDPAGDVSISIAAHTLRAYWLTPSGYVQTEPPPPTVYADGRPLIVAQTSLPMPEAVLTGGGRTYVRVMNGVDEDHPHDLWIADVSFPKVTVTRRIVGCNPTRQMVLDGAYVTTCNVNGEKRTVTHSYKDGLLK